MSTLDAVVLGGGPAGYATALRAAARGLRVVLVEADRVGGTCLHRGCIPSKVLLHAGAVLDTARRAGTLGLRLLVEDVDVNRLRAHKDGVQESLHRGLRELLRTRGVDVVTGHGRLLEPGVVDVDGTRLVARAVVVATGSSVRDLPGVTVDREVVVTSDDATALPRLPRRVAVLGAGPVGLELASLWRSLGAEQVTVVEALDRIAPTEDADVSKELARQFERRGITCLAGARVESIELDGDGKEALVVVDGPEPRDLRVDTVLVATGRRPNTHGIGLEGLGVLTDSGHVATDGSCRTTIEGVFAAGDVVAPPALALAHAGFVEGIWVADQLAGEPPPGPVDYEAIPRVTYSHPEVASVGLTEEQARERLADHVRVVRQALRGNARALAAGDDGFAKLVLGPGGEVLGAHLVGGPATELIALGQLAVAWGATASDFAHLTLAHPTTGEVLGEALHAAAGLPLH